MNVGGLRPAAYNPRKISDAELAALKQSEEVFGDLGGIVFNRRTGNLVGGHQRVKTLDPSWKIIDSEPEAIGTNITEGDKKVGTVFVGWIDTPFGRISYREVDWDEKVEKAANLAANRHGGAWDNAKLKEVLVGLDDGSPLVELTGFSQTDLEGLIGRGPAPELPSDSENLFSTLTFTLTKEQLALVGWALDAAVKAGPFSGTGNQNDRGNALVRICEAYKK